MNYRFEAGIVSISVGLAIGPAAPAQFYDYKVIAKAGQAGLTGMGDGPSINDGDAELQPMLAFIGQTQGVEDKFEGVFVGDGTENPTNISPAFTEEFDNLAPSCQINSSGDVVGRSTKPNPNGPAFSYIWRWNWLTPDDAVGIANSVQQDPFRAVNPDPTMNAAGTVVWSGLDANVKKVLATGVPDDYTFRQLTTAPVRPMLSDFGQVVTRLGNSPTDPITLLNASLTKVADIATSANFSMLGQSPGISNDARIVVFAADLTQAGADAINAAQANWDYGLDGKAHFWVLKPGPGVFASVNTNLGRVIARIAGAAGNGILDPGERYDDLNHNGDFDPATETDSGPCASFPYPDARVAVDGNLDNQRAVTVCYMAADAQGHQALFTNRLNCFAAEDALAFSADIAGGLYAGQTATVIKVGDTIPGLAGAVESLGVYDQLNGRDRGDVGFYAKTSSSAAIVRARPFQVVFLDFDPLHNFRDTPEADSLFADLGVPSGWAGNMDEVFKTLAPNRNDLNSPNALKTIQNSIVDYVQQRFDLLWASGLGVKVKVLGKVGDAPPVGGPYIRTFLGDGTNDDAHPSGTNGITPGGGAVFNQKMRYAMKVNGVLHWGVPVPVNPIILLDNMFRLSTGNFTTEDINHLQRVGLDDTGPHKITVDQAVYAIGGTTAHELGHSMGLEHIDDSLSELLMNAYSSSPINGGLSFDEKRLKRTFGEFPQNFDPHEFATGTQNCAALLALAVGSDAPEVDLSRDEPSPEALAREHRDRFDLSLDLGQSVSVARAAIGVVSGFECSEPEFQDLGAGDLETLVNAGIDVGASDEIVLIASTDGNGIDIFGVKAGYGGDVDDIDLSSALLAMTDDRIRARPIADDGQPLKQVLDVYHRTPNGDVLLGSIGDPQGNAGPLAKDNQADTASGQPVVINVLGNDTDPDGLNKASVAIVADPENGAAIPDPATGKIQYRSEVGFGGVVTFRYSVADNLGAPSNEATVTVTVSGGVCYADFDGNGTLDLFDFLGFVNAFNTHDAQADCTQDGTFDLFDFLCFVNAFNAGC